LPKSQVIDYEVEMTLKTGGGPTNELYELI